MPSQKISEMPLANTLTGAELVPVVQDGLNKQSTAQKVSEVAAPTNVSQLNNDVPYASSSGSGRSGPVAVRSGADEYGSSDTVSIDPVGELSAPSIETVELQVTGDLLLDLQVDRAFLFMDGDTVSSSPEAVWEPDATAKFENLTCVLQFGVGGGAFNVDSAGNCDATTLKADDGFTGTGVYTTFEIVAGIIISAS